MLESESSIIIRDQNKNGTEKPDSISASVPISVPISVPLLFRLGPKKQGLRNTVKRLNISA